MADETESAGAPAPAETTTPTAPDTGDASEQPKEQTAEQETVVEADDGDDTGGDGPPKKVPGSQRIKRRYQALAAEHERLQREVDDLRRRSPPADQTKREASPDDKPPSEADYNGDYLAFERARTAWETVRAVRHELRSEMERQQSADRERRASEVKRELAVAYSERLEEAREKIPDFDATMGKMAGVSVKDDVIEEIMLSDKGPLLAYYLAKNPDRLRELNTLSGKEIAREIGRLEGSVRLPSAKTKTQAPPPPTQIGAGGAAGTSDPSKMSMDEYVKWRAAQEKRA